LVPIKEVVTDETFNQRVLGPEAGGPWLISFSAGEWCGPCTALTSQLRGVSRKLAGHWKVGLLHCDVPQNGPLCEKYGVQAYPNLHKCDSATGCSPFDNPYGISNTVIIELCVMPFVCVCVRVFVDLWID
jgi:thiol-disulfide isomerase/thioredoxin